MKIDLITYGDDAVWKRKTVMLDGKQIGYVNDAPGAAVLMTVPATKDDQAEIAAEVARLKGETDSPRVSAPVPIAPEMFEPDDDTLPDDYE